MGHFILILASQKQGYNECLMPDVTLPCLGDDRWWSSCSFYPLKNNKAV